MSLDKTLYVKVKLDDTGVQAQLNRLKSSLSSIQNVGGGKATKEVNSLGDAFSSTITKGLKFGAVAVALKKVGDAAASCIKSASDLQEAMNISGTMYGYGTLSKWVDDVGAKFGIAAVNAHTYAGTMASMLQSMGVSQNNFKEMSKNLTQLAGDFASFYNISSDDAFAKIRSGMAGQVRGLQTLGINMTQANLNAWMLSHGIHAQFKELNQASQEMVRYNYIMDKTRHIQGDFAKTSGSWANQTRTLALQWSKFKSIVGSGLIAALTPVVKLLNTVIGLAIKAAQAIAAFFGWKMKVNESGGSGGDSGGVGGLADDLDNTGKAADNAGKGLGNTGKAAKNTTKAVKELKKELMGFDKINNLTKQEDTSGVDTGGGSGGSGSGGSGGSGNHGGLDVGLERLDYSKIEDPLKNLLDLFGKLKPLISSFKEGFKEGFGDAGKYFDIIKEDAKRLKGALKELVLDPKVKESFDNLAKSASKAFGQIVGSIARIGLTLASAGFGGFVDGFIEKLDKLKKRIIITNNNMANIFKGIGNIAVDVADMIEVNYPKIRSIAKNVSKIFIESISGMATVVSGIGSSIVEGIAKVIRDNKDKIATALGNVLSGLDKTFEDIDKVASNLWDGLIEATEKHLKPAVEAVFGFISKAVNGFLSLFNKIDFKSLIPPSVISLAKEIGDYLGDIFDIIKDIVKALTPIAKVVGTIIGAIAGAKLIAALQAIKIALQVISGLVITLLAPIRAVVKAIKHILEGDIFTADAWADILSPFKDAWTALKDTLSTIWETIKGAWKFLWDSVEKIGTSAIEGIKGIFSGLGKWFSKLWGGIKETASAAWSGIKTIFAPVANFFKGVWDKVTNVIKTAWNAIKTTASTLWSGIKTIFTPVGAWFKDKWDFVVNAIKTAWNTIKTTASNLWTGIKNIFNGVGTWFKGKWNAIYTAVNGVWNNIKKAASNLWTGIKNVFNNVGTWFKNKWTSAYNAVTGVFRNIGSFFSGIWSRIKNTFSRFGSSMGSAFSSAFKSGINGVISIIESSINTAINLINGAIGLINKIPGVSVGTVGHVSLPRLAKGGYIDREMVATIGEAGPEAVIPLSNTKADQLKPLANQIAQSIATINNSQPTNITVEPTVEVQLNGDLNKFLSFAATKNNTRNKMLGIGLNPA